MPVLTLTYGLPGCGKSTWANQEVKKKNSQTIILCRDDLRQMIAGSHENYKFNSGTENFVHDMMFVQATDAYDRGWNVIVADTNLDPKTIGKWNKYCTDIGFTLKIKNFYTEFLEEKKLSDDYFGMNAFRKLCKARNLTRSKIVDEEVIDGMFEKYFLSRLSIPQNSTELPAAVIFDIDGTLAEHEGIRSPYDHTNVLLDVPNTDVIEMVQMERDAGRTIIIMSGRKDLCRDDTVKWLEQHGVQYSHLYMRAGNDNRSDDIVKYELFMSNVHGKYYTQKVYDDRNKVCEMWRTALGLRVFQVAPGNF